MINIPEGRSGIRITPLNEKTSVINDPKKLAEHQQRQLEDRGSSFASNFGTLAQNYDRLLKEGEKTFVAIVEGKIVGEKFETFKKALDFIHSDESNNGKAVLVSPILREVRARVKTKTQTVSFNTILQDLQRKKSAY